MADPTNDFWPRVTDDLAPTYSIAWGVHDSPTSPIWETIAAGGNATTCPDCNGSGEILLFTSRSRCRRCNGSGRVESKKGRIDAFPYHFDRSGSYREIPSVCF